MPINKKSETARANGAKSRGPVTPEGLARSSQNAIQHGLTAKSANLPPVNVLLTCESKEEFQTLLDSYLHQFTPQPGVETELVHAMATARWRLRRIVAMETMLLDNEMLVLREESEDHFKENGILNTKCIDHLTYAFQSLVGGPTLALLVRYEGTVNRSHDRAFKQLQILQAARNRPQPNEPKPTNLKPSPTLIQGPASDSEAALPSRRATIEVSPPINAKHLHP